LIPILFNLSVDPSERFDLAEEHPEILSDITKMVEEHEQTVKPVESQLDIFIRQ
jgi:hypothetical protein